jgi:hypothetical protein
MTAPATTAEGMVLDTLDREVILYIHRIRRSTGTGPTWAELRAAVPGLPPRPDLSVAAFEAWLSDPANQVEQVERPPGAAWRRRAYGVWRARRLDADPLKQRLCRLRWAGYVSFSDRERSLDVGQRVRGHLREVAATRAG